MPDQEKIKKILREHIAPGKSVTEQQLTELSTRIKQLPKLDESALEKIASEVIQDPKGIVLGAVDMSDINNELKK